MRVVGEKVCIRILIFLISLYLLVSIVFAVDPTPTLTPLPTPTEIPSGPSILIGESTETATTLAATSEGATVVDNCMIISSPGYYLLSQSISESDAPVCIEIAEDDVIFDGGGNIIDGNNTISSVGVRVWKASGHYSNVTIKNVTVTDWGNGIQVKILENGTMENCEISHNEVGIHLNVQSSNIRIANNTITENALAGIMFESNTRSNRIYNNFFNNTNNVVFIYSGDNIWNISPILGTNIINGEYIGGNYWTNPEGSGFSDTCLCAGNGICVQDYSMIGNNIDLEPLCVPGITIIVHNLMEPWYLRRNIYNPYPEAAQIFIYSSGPWMLKATADHNGKLTGNISGKQLTSLLQIRENKSPPPDFEFLDSEVILIPSGTGDISLYIDLRQYVESVDPDLPFPEVYTLNITYTATMW